MSAFAILLLALAACVVVHVLAMAACATALGLRVSELALGYGPHWLKLGRLRLGVLPWGGYVRFAALPEDVLSVPAQLLLVSTGVATLLLVSVALLGVAGLGAFLDGFRQLLDGTTSPFGSAQAMFAAMRRQSLEGPFVVTLGLAAAKLAMVNVVPFPSTNGGHALAVVGRWLGIARRWPEAWTTSLNTLQVVVFVAWVIALVAYVAWH